MISNLCEFMEDESPVDGIVCIKCGEEKPISHFSQMKYKSNKSDSEIKRTCKECRKKTAKIIKKLRKENPNVPSKSEECPSCGYTLEYLGRYGQTVFKNWRLHHDHKTEKFLGYVCHRCNEGFGAFNDDYKLMEKALKWHKEQIKKCMN